MTYCALMSLDTVLKCSVAVIWVCRVVTANFMSASQTHVIKQYAVDKLRPASNSSYIRVAALF